MEVTVRRLRSTLLGVLVVTFVLSTTSCGNSLVHSLADYPCGPITGGYQGGYQEHFLVWEAIGSQSIMFGLRYDHLGY